MKNYICIKYKECEATYSCYHKIPHEQSLELNCNDVGNGHSTCEKCRPMSEEEAIMFNY